jgi:hypothetical protein
MRAIAVVAALGAGLVGTGCYAPSFEGILCGAEGECPSGFACRDDRCSLLGSPDGPDIDGGVDDDGSLPPLDGLEVDATGDPDAAFDAMPLPPDGHACPSNYLAVDGQSSLYRVVAAADDWLSAELDCEKDGAATGGGTHLVVLDDAAELAALDPHLAANVWIGMVDRVDEGTFVLVTGPGAVFLPFRSGEPNDGGPLGFTEDCIELAGNVLNDDGCTTNRQYVCECDGAAADPSAYTPADDPPAPGEP